ncbi:MAG: transglycosylase domain-containing protein [Oscillospiraceae bacterium]|nr:transglycosylase domain-containing protein [Oscillospiraceae bacterium]
MDKNKAKKTAKAAAGTTVGTVSGVFRVVLKVLATLLLIFITTGLLFTCIFAYYVKTNLSDDLDISLEDMTLNLASTIYYTDASGNEVALASLHGNENRIWVDYENIPKQMSQAAIAIEDKRFLDHHGVDWYRTTGAFVNMFLSMKNDFGGSTITQQLIKNLTKEDDITVQRKILEIFRALKLEKMYTKDQIMEWYLNVSFFGENCNGVATAAKTYFDKDVWDLDLAECASIVGITNNPSKYDPYISRSNNKKRQELILAEMYEQGFITNDEYTQAVSEELVFKRGENEKFEQPINSYYVDAVIEDVTNDLMQEKGINKETAQNLLYNGGLQIYSCLDMKAQDIVDTIYQDPTNFPTVKSPAGESLQSAVVVLDPYTGEIKALSGGIGTKTGNLIFNRAVDALRPPGSSIKPIAIYGPAIDQGLISPTTLVDDNAELKLNGTSWYPRNAGGGNAGVITIQQALTSSINTVSAQILDKLSPSVSYTYLSERLGVVSLVDSDRDYAPLALGQLTNGITVREMAQAYDAFVNDGVFTYARSYTHITDSEGNMVLDNPAETIVAFKANTAWTMSYMLNIAATYGTGSESYLGNMPHAGKTGSSSDYCDRWFVGFTPYYVAAVWTGYDTPARMYVTGNPSAQIWKKIMYPLNDGLEYKAFKTPTLSGPTNIFGELSATPSPSPSEESSESPSDDSNTTGTDIPTPSAPVPSLPVTPSPSNAVSPAA